MDKRIVNEIQVINVRDIKKIFPSEYSNRKLFSKFIDYTMNYMFQEPIDEQVSNYVGKKTYPYDSGVHFIKEPTTQRDLYQLDPTIVVTDNLGNTKYACDYTNIVNALGIQGAITSNHNRLFSADIWSWAPPINPDMFLNFNYYYWIPAGVTPFVLDTPTDVVANVIGKKHYTYVYTDEETEESKSVEFTSGMRIQITDDANLEYNGNIYLVEGVGKSIYLIEDNPHEEEKTKDPITGEEIITDTSKINGFSKDPDYIVMDRGAIDGNPWSTGNRWFHKSAFDKLNVDTTTFIQAKRPIINFVKNIQLYNYGRYFRQQVDIVYNGSKIDFEAIIAGNYQNITFEDGIRVLIVGDTNVLLNNRIYVITNQNISMTPMLQLVADGLNIDGSPAENEGFIINSKNSVYGGKYLYYKNGAFIEGQQKINPLTARAINAMPEFYVYDTDKEPLDNNTKYPETTFDGNKLFSYKCDDTNDNYEIDEELDHRIIVASGSNYLFENNFTEDKYYYNNENALVVDIPGMRLYRVNGNTPNADIYVSNWLSSGNTASTQSITSFIDLQEELQPVNQVYYYTSAGESLVVNDSTIIQSASSPSGRWVSIGNDDSGLMRVKTIDEANLTHGIDGTLLIIDELTRVYTYDSNAGAYDIDNVNYIATADGRNSRWIKTAGGNGIRIYEFATLDEIQNKTNLIDNDLAIFAATSKYRIKKEYDLVTEPIQNVSYKNNFIYKNGKILNEDVAYTIVGKTLAFTSLADLSKSDLITIQVINPNYNEYLDTEHAYSLPLNLSSNAENKEVNEISYNNILEHLQSIIKNQVGFTGDVNGNNNYSSTPQDISRGTEIIQNVAPLLKVPVLNSKEYTDVINVISFAQNEYQNYKYRFNATANRLAKTTVFTNNSDITIFVKNVIKEITIGKNETDAFYNNGVGYSDMECFIPATPSWLGIAPLFKPGIISINGTKLILGHDGSLTNAFDDYRDNILIEFETAIYNSVLPEISQKDPIFEMYKYIPGAFRDTLYTQSEYSQLLRPDFERWALDNNLIYTTNAGYSENDPWSWNYSSLTDYKGRQLPGNWRGIYLYFYDTISPNTTPWEMLGFGEKPYKLDILGNKVDWWELRYGPAPYTCNNYQLWRDLADGYIADGPRAGYHPEFARKDLLDFIPVDEHGDLLNPIQIGLCTEKPTLYYASRNWKYGDMADVEWLWTTQSCQKFSIQKAMYLMRPTEWTEYNWDTENIVKLFSGTDYEQIYYKDLDRRSTPADVVMHNEKDEDNKYIRKIGVQQWFSDNVSNEKCNITTYIADDLRHTTLKLGYKCASFYKADTIKLNSESIGFIPEKNYSLGLYKSLTPKIYTYSAMRVVYVDGKYRVDGYDTNYPFFTYFTPVYSGTKHGITVGSRNITYYNIWNKQEQKLPYGYEFENIQSLFDFIIGYGKWLENCGWYYLNVDNAGTIINWDSCAKDCLVWINSSKLENGSFVLLNPGVVKIGLKHTGIIDNVCSRVNGIWGTINISYEPMLSTKIKAYRQFGKTIFESDVAIGLIKAKSYEYEHMIILDNYTIFGDILYDTLLNVRIRRLQLLGIRASAWNGTLFAPGYIIADNGAIQNFENYANSFLKFYDTDSTACSGEVAKYVKSTIGFVEKDYMKNLLVDDKSMFDFYKGMLREKGTTAAYNKVAASTYIMANMIDDKLTTQENWMFHVGTFGNVGSKYPLEFVVENTSIKQNPQQIIFTTSDTLPSSEYIITDYDNTMNSANHEKPVSIIGAITYTKNDIDGWLLRNSTDSNNTFEKSVHTDKMPTGGFARIGDADFIFSTFDDFNDKLKNFAENFSAFDYSLMIDGANEAPTGCSAWIVKDKDNDWNMYKIYCCGHLVNAEINSDLNYTGSTKLTFKENDTALSLNHLKVGDKIVIDDSTLNLFAEQGLFEISSIDNESDTVVYCDNVLNYETTLEEIPVYSITSLKIKDISEMPAMNKKFIQNNYVYVSSQNLGYSYNYAFEGKSQYSDAMQIIDGKLGIHYLGTTPNVSVYDTLYIPAASEQGYINTDNPVVESIDAENHWVFLTSVVVIDLSKQPKAIPVYVKKAPINVLHTTEGYQEGRDIYDPNIILQESINDYRWLVFKCIEHDNTLEFALQRYEKTARVDTQHIKSAYIINDVSDETQATCQLYDPLKMIFPKVADNISYLMGYDPASYNGNLDVLWDKSHLNELWWDISTVRYIDYEQYNTEYRRSYWGKHLPGSAVDIYEWSRVTENPEEVFGEKYNTFTETNNGVTETAYYGWIKNSDKVPDNCDRKISAQAISTILLDPTDAGIMWVSPIYSEILNDGYVTDIVIANAGNVITDDKSVLQLNIDKKPETDIHKEWVMIRENSSQDIYDWLWTYMTYSLMGHDEMKVPNVLPDPTLPDRYKTGINYTKKQSMFGDMLAARKIFVEIQNRILAEQEINKADIDDETGIDYWTECFMAEEPYPADITEEYMVDTLTDLNGIYDDTLDGKVLLVKHDEMREGRWSTWLYNKNYNVTVPRWTLVSEQSYKMPNYWSYTDMYKTQEYGLTKDTPISYVFDTQAQYLTNVKQYNLEQGDFVKYYDNNHKWVIVVFTKDMKNQDVFNVAGKEDGTVKLSSKIYDFFNDTTLTDEEKEFKKNETSIVVKLLMNYWKHVSD